MADVNFSDERLLEQASGNQSAMFFVGMAWAKHRDGSIDAWADFIGEQFADSWEELRDSGALAVARMAGLNLASSADSKLVGLEGDDWKAEILIEGPDPEWLENTRSRKRTQIGRTSASSDASPSTSGSSSKRDAMRLGCI